MEQLDSVDWTLVGWIVIFFATFGFLEPRIKDKDNNTFSLVSCTLKQAIKNLETLENCKDCADCVNCVDCYRCENCTD